MNGISNPILESIASKVKAIIETEKVPKWDLYLLDEQVNGVYFRRLDYELFTDSHNITYFLRIFTDQPENKMGVGLIESNSADEENIREAIHQAQAIAKVNTGPKYDLVTSGKTYPAPKTTDKEIWDDTDAFLSKTAARIKTCLSETFQVDSCFGKFRCYKTNKMLMNSTGLNLIKRSNYFCYEFSLKASKEGRVAEYWPKGYLKSINHLKFEDYIPQWGSLARDSVNAKLPPIEKSIEVIFPPPVVRSALLSTIGYALSAKSLYEKTTPFQPDQKVSNEGFNMADDGLLAEGLNTSAFDGEGTPKTTNKLIERGILKRFLYDQKYGTLLNATPTGNGTRHGGAVSIDINNLVVDPGNTSIRDMISECKHGLYVDAFSWLNPNPLTGVFGAEIRNAYMIEAGHLDQPVKGGTLSGNVYEMLKNITGISKEVHNFMNAKVPFIKFANLTITAE